MIDSTRIKITKIKNNRVNNKYSGTYTTESGNVVKFNMIYNRAKKTVSFNPGLNSYILEQLISDELLPLV